MSKFNVFFLTLLFPFFSMAQDTASALLNEVVVTANKYPKKQSETGKVLTVLNSRTLQQMGSRTLPEILNTVAGVSINGANNNLGTNQGLSIRGASFGNALILLNGIPVNDPSVISNYFDLNFIAADQIERIEILKGGQSTLYGSDAVTGVINIITKKAPQKPISVRAQLTAGSYHTYEGTAGISGHAGLLSYNLQHTFTTSKGFSTAFDSSGTGDFDKDQYKQNTSRGELGIALNEEINVKLFGAYSRYKAGIDGAAFQDDKDYTTENRNIQGGAGMVWKMPGGNLILNYQYNDLDRNYLNDSSDRSNPFSYYLASKYKGKTHYAEVYKSFSWAAWELLAGADYRSNNSDQNEKYTFLDFFSGTPVTGESSLDRSIAHTWQLSPYASLIYKYKNLSVEGGSRYNRHSTYGNNVTYTFNPSYLIKEKVKLFFNASSAFKAPSLYQLYVGFAGNKDLAPEKSNTLEGGVSLYLASHFKSRITLFNRNTKNAIQYVVIDPSTFASQYRNVNKQENRGAETEISFENEKWNAAANYTYTQGKITSDFSETGSGLTKDTTYNNLYRVPKHALNVIVFYNLTPKFNVGSVLRFVGNRLEPVYGSAPITLDRYYTLDLSGSYRISPHFRLFADVKNITDQTYFDVSGYNSRRFHFNTGLSVTL